MEENIGKNSWTLVLQEFSGYVIERTSNKVRNEQPGLHQITKLLYSKRNNQQNEKVTNRRKYCKQSIWPGVNI